MALIITAGALVLIAIEPAQRGAWLFHRMLVFDAFAVFFRALIALAALVAVWMSIGSVEVRALRPGRVLRHPARQHARDVPDGGGDQPADGISGAGVREPHLLHPDRFPAPQPPLAGGRAEVPDLRRRRVGHDGLRDELDFRNRRLARLWRDQPGARRDRPYPGAHRVHRAGADPGRAGLQDRFGAISHVGARRLHWRADSHHHFPCGWIEGGRLRVADALFLPGDLAPGRGRQLAAARTASTGRNCCWSFA